VATKAAPVKIKKTVKTIESVDIKKPISEHLTITSRACKKKSNG